MELEGKVTNDAEGMVTHTLGPFTPSWIKRAAPTAEYGPTSARLRSVKTALFKVSGPCFPMRSPAKHSSWLEGEQPITLLKLKGLYVDEPHSFCKLHKNMFEFVVC